MALDIWFKEDIRNILLGVELASAHLATCYSDAEVRAYREGFRTALAAAALSLGICAGEIDAEIEGTQSRMPLLPFSRGRQP